MIEYESCFPRPGSAQGVMPVPLGIQSGTLPQVDWEEGEAENSLRAKVRKFACGLPHTDTAVYMG